MNDHSICGPTNREHRSFRVKPLTDDALDILFQCQDAGCNPHTVPVLNDGIFQSLLEYAVDKGPSTKRSTRRHSQVKSGKKTTKRRTRRRS